MSKKPNHITVFEHQCLWTHKGKDPLSPIQLTALQQFYGEKGVPFYKLIHKGVQFKEYVGVLQIGDLVIEVLPKADKYTTEKDWQAILTGMLLAVGAFNIHAPSASALRLKSNFILDLYFELFIVELEYLFHKGLIKKYRKTEGNILALKGNILFSKHLQQNVVHQERFYVRHTQYDQQHLFHQILYKTLRLLQRINTNVALNSRIGHLLLHFPEMEDIKVSDATFTRLVLNRKTEDYENAIAISKLLLLNYHPDLCQGKMNVLALMFDMNLLWEQFIYVSLRKHLRGEMTITAQTTMDFWKSTEGHLSKIKPDIVINQGKADAAIIDTKWKNLGDGKPSPDDLRQLYVYHEYYQAQKVALVYPGTANIYPGHYFYPNERGLSQKECSVISLPTEKVISVWQESIARELLGRWLGGE
ncbi:MAG: restriction endonuclease [Saprospiraceae bacterium]